MHVLHVLCAPPTQGGLRALVGASARATVLPLSVGLGGVLTELGGADVISPARLGKGRWNDLADLIWCVAPDAVAVHGVTAGRLALRAARWLELPVWGVLTPADLDTSWARARTRLLTRGCAGIVLPEAQHATLGGTARELAADGLAGIWAAAV